MNERPQTLADLINARVGRRRNDTASGRLTFDEFAMLAIDPVSHVRISAKVAWKLARGERVHVTPEMCKAIAVGLDLPLVTVQAAAAYQFTGLDLYAALREGAAEDEVDAMSWDPIPDEHSADVVVTMSGDGPMSPEERETLLDIVRLREQGLPIPTRLDDDG